MSSRSNDIDAAARDEILALAGVGKLSPEEAERRALEESIGPLAHEPDPSIINPMKLSTWTLAMATAWVAARQVSCVQRVSCEFAAATKRWKLGEWEAPTDNGGIEEGEGWFLESLPSPTFRTVLLLESRCKSDSSLSNPWLMSADDARKEIWKSLAEGKLNAEALHKSAGPIEVQSREWLYMSLIAEKGRDILQYQANGHEAPFTDLMFKKDQLLGAWPASPPVFGTIKQEIACRRWLSIQVENSPHCRPKPKASFWSEAQGLFKPLSKRQFDRAWDEATLSSPDWRKAGRPAQKSNHRTS